MVKMNRLIVSLTASVFIMGCAQLEVDDTKAAPVHLMTNSLSTGLVIRGGVCSRASFISGAESSTPDGEYITNLSVNCTTQTSNKANYASYTKGIPNEHLCIAQWSSLAAANVAIVRDPTRNNDLHCLLSGKTKNVVKYLTRYK